MKDFPSLTGKIFWTVDSDTGINVEKVVNLKNIKLLLVDKQLLIKNIKRNIKRFMINGTICFHNEQELFTCLELEEVNGNEKN